jgi:hypothetical protein
MYPKTICLLIKKYNKILLLFQNKFIIITITTNVKSNLLVN